MIGSQIPAFLNQVWIDSGPLLLIYCSLQDRDITYNNQQLFMRSVIFVLEKLGDK